MSYQSSTLKKIFISLLKFQNYQRYESRFKYLNLVVFNPSSSLHFHLKPDKSNSYINDKELIGFAARAATAVGWGHGPLFTEDGGGRT